MKLLITGIRGFVGDSIGQVAREAGHEVLGISRVTQPANHWHGQYVTVDVVTADLSSVIRDFGPDGIFHATGTASVDASFGAPLDDLRASLLSWANLLDGVRRSGTRPLILFPSSGAVYGRLAELPVREDWRVNPISPYGFHKAACELLAREYAACFDQRIIVCRLFSLFGERQRRLLVWELFQQFAGAEEVVWLQGTGEETRDYLYAPDMAAAILTLFETKLRPTSAGLGSETVWVNYEEFNVASGIETGVVNLAKQIGMLLGRPKEVRCRGSHRAGDPERWQADITRLRSAIPQWKPRPLADGLANCVTGWQSEYKP